jgi:hypothetical protein
MIERLNRNTVEGRIDDLADLGDLFTEELRLDVGGPAPVTGSKKRRASTPIQISSDDEGGSSPASKKSRFYVHKKSDDRKEESGAGLGKLKMPSVKFSVLQNITDHDCNLYGFTDNQELALVKETLRLNVAATLKPVQGSGSCLFQAVLSQLDAPEEYTADCLRKQLINWMCSHAGLMLAAQGEQIRAEYGLPDGADRPGTPVRTRQADVASARTSMSSREGDNLAGPFSYQSYLSYMLRPGSWGDQTVIFALSMMLNLRISVLLSNSLTHLAFRHSGGLGQADIILIYNGRDHYNTIGKLYITFYLSIGNTSVLVGNTRQIVGNRGVTVGNTTTGYFGCTFEL